MTLPDFILSHMEEILSDWERFASSIPAAQKMDPGQLRDHAREILESIARDMQQEQSREEQFDKSRGEPETAGDTAAKQHGGVRQLSGFTVSDMVSEFRALRATVIRRWADRPDSSEGRSLYELTRFNEGIDQALAESTGRFMERIDHAREIFLAVLGHDLRNPLGAVLHSAQYLMRTDTLTGNQVKAVTAMYSSGRRMQKMVEDLLDVARTRLGQSLPIDPREANLATVCEDIVSEIQAFNPDRIVRCSTSGDLTGSWDAGRLSQVLSNLLGNGLQHGTPDKPVTVSAHGLDDRVELKVHNHGRVAPDELDRIFEPLVRGRDGRQASQSGHSLGLGLYIAREIAEAHGGRIDTESSDTAGTTFTVVLPRNRRPPLESSV